MDNKVSIITPCLNGEEFVCRYLQSILNQTYKNIELIFVNDGSTDKTEEIVKSYISKFENEGMTLKYIYKQNSGQAASLNKGLKIFTGEYLTWPDSDDILAKDSIEKKVAFLQQNKDCGLVRTDASLVDEENIKVIRRYFAENKLNKYSNDIFFELITERMYVCCGCYMVRTNSFLDVNPLRNIYEGKGGQNWQMLLPITYKYKCGYIDEPLYTYVVRSNSHSHNDIDLNSCLKRCDEHEDILLNTINSINMNKEECEKYLSIIEEKYVRKRFNLASDFNDKNLSEKFYKQLKTNYSIGKSEIVQYISTRNIIFNLSIRAIRKMKRSLT